MITIMHVAKNILIKVAVSLVAGVASTIGVRLTNMIWDKSTCNKTYERTEKMERTFAQ